MGSLLVGFFWNPTYKGDTFRSGAEDVTSRHSTCVGGLNESTSCRTHYIVPAVRKVHKKVQKKVLSAAATALLPGMRNIDTPLCHGQKGPRQARSILRMSTPICCIKLVRWGVFSTSAFRVFNLAYVATRQPADFLLVTFHLDSCSEPPPRRCRAKNFKQRHAFF